jgi:hypothetical protein
VNPVQVKSPIPNVYSPRPTVQLKPAPAAYRPQPTVLARPIPAALAGGIIQGILKASPVELSLSAIVENWNQYQRNEITKEESNNRYLNFEIEGVTGGCHVRIESDGIFNPAHVQISYNQSKKGAKTVVNYWYEVDAAGQIRSTSPPDKKPAKKGTAASLNDLAKATADPVLHLLRAIYQGAVV